MANADFLRAAVRAMGLARAGLNAADQRLHMAMNAKAPAVTQELLDAKTRAGLAYTAAVDRVLQEERDLGLAEDEQAAHDDVEDAESRRLDATEPELPFGREA